ncbi:MAG TPA: arsenate reductase family protein [Candidatus Scybalousia intestinigallinarum]|nr:arsenate reductase family protein [Candidatus Scybalousia intestinigallinarum]
MLLIEYPKCSTCQKAKKFLDSHHQSYECRNIVLEPPTEEEIRTFLSWGVPLGKLFNTSGMLYRELNLKDKLPNMTEDEKISLLASNGMLVKRPLLVVNEQVLVGFKELEWKKLIKENEK